MLLSTHLLTYPFSNLPHSNSQLSIANYQHRLRVSRIYHLNQKQSSPDTQACPKVRYLIF